MVLVAVTFMTTPTASAGTPLTPAICERAGPARTERRRRRAGVEEPVGRHGVEQTATRGGRRPERCSSPRRQRARRCCRRSCRSTPCRRCPLARRPGSAPTGPARSSGSTSSAAAVPVGHAVRYPGAEVLVPVRFITTAATPSAGTPPRPVTWRSRMTVRAERGLRGPDARAGVEDAVRHQRHELAARRPGRPASSPTARRCPGTSRRHRTAPACRRRSCRCRPDHPCRPWP